MFDYRIPNLQKRKCHEGPQGSRETKVGNLPKTACSMDMLPEHSNGNDTRHKHSRKSRAKEHRKFGRKETEWDGQSKRRKEKEAADSSRH